MPFNPKPNRLSPLHSQHQTLGAHFGPQGDWLIPEVYTTAVEETTVLRENVGLIDISAWGKLTLKGAKALTVLAACFGDIPTKPGEVREIKVNHISVAALTPDEFLILTPPGAEKELATSLETEIIAHGIFVSVIDQTSGLVGLSISGPRTTELMRKLCAIPFHSGEFPNLSVVQSSFAKIRGMIIRHDRGDLPTFELFADCSYGEYLWESILDAGKEFGIRPVGWEAMGG